MKYLLAVPLVFLMLSTYSQDNDQLVIDSLEQLITKKKVKGKSLYETKVELSKALVKENPEKGLGIVQEVLDKYQKQDVLLVKANLAAALNYLDLGKKDEMKLHLDRAFEISTEYNLPEGMKESYKAHYKCYDKIKREVAYKKILEAVEYAEKSGDPEFKRIIFNDRGLLEYRYKRNIKEARKWIKRSLDMAVKTDNQSKIAGLTMNLGAMYYQDGKYDESLKYYDKSLEALRKMDKPSLHGKVFLNIAITKYSQNKLDSAIYFSQKAIEKYAEADDSMNIASGYIQIGGINMDRANYKESIKWLTKAMKIYDDLPNTDYKKHRVLKMLSMNYSRIENEEAHSSMIDGMLELSQKLGDSVLIAEAYKYRGQFFNKYNDSLERSIELLNKANEIYEALGLLRYQQSLYLDFGNTYQKMKLPRKARPYFEKALAVYEQYPERQKENIAGTLSNLGVIAYDLGEYDESIKYYERALQMRKELDIPRDILDSYLTLRNTYEAKKDYVNAFKYAKKYSVLKDSIFKDDLSKDLAEMRTKYETEKKEQENKLLQKDNDLKNAELDKAALENERSKMMLAGSAGGGLLVIILALVSYRGYLRKKKDNNLLQQKNVEIQTQNIEIKEKNAEIMDSIRYAQRIQETILPANQLIKSYFRNSFIFYKPKELVSGDFYWMKSLEEQKGDKLMFSAVDCTGHGVPGAFVSIVGHNGLNRAVNEFELRSPKLILQKLNELVVESFAPNEEMSVKDGMDLAFCMIDEQNILHFAGANNPLWIVSLADSNIENRIKSETPERIRTVELDNVKLTEIKADKRPIGAFDGENKFTEHKIELSKGDTVYVFSDGYADQFGGANNKKMKSGKFKKILAESYPQLMDEQRETLRKAFDNWKGDFEQIDDVCVIGYRFEGSFIPKS